MKTIKVFLSGVAVYLSVASINACGGTDSLPTWATSSSSGVTVSGAGGAPMASTANAGGSGGKTVGGTGGKAGHGGGGGMMNPVPDALAESGSRIKAQWIVGVDGSKTFAGFYDSDRKEVCAYQPMQDGNRHCVPTGVAGFYAGAIYSDAACTIDLAYMHNNSCPSAHAYGYKLGAPAMCSVGTYYYTIFSLGPKVTPSMVYTKSGANCVMTPAPMDSEIRLVLGEIPPSAFVAGTLTTDS